VISWRSPRLGGDQENRGHYRSCGKDPHTCCVSHLLTDEPVIRSGREATYTLAKTLAVIGMRVQQRSLAYRTEEQVEEGIKTSDGARRGPGSPD